MYFIDTKGRTDFAFPPDSRTSNNKLFNEFEIVCAQAAKVSEYFPEGTITIELCNRKKQWQQQSDEGIGSGAEETGKGKARKRDRTDMEQEEASEQQEAPKRKKGKGPKTKPSVRKIDTAK